MRALLAGLALVLASASADAAAWRVDPSRSHLGITVQWSNEPFTAAFKSWKAEIAFDPADLAHARADVSVDLTSETSGEPEFDDGLKGALGFQTDRFPQARFVTTGFVHKSGPSYVATGRLSIRGVARDITLPFTLTIDGTQAHMTGVATVMRTDFGVGQGEWAAPSPVAHAVTISIDLYATRT